MDDGMRLTDLVAAVQARAAGHDEVARLDAAIMASRETETLADQLLDHFVGRARTADLSWTVIGERLGVSKQAARTRFAERVDPLVVDDAANDAAMELAPRLLSCLDRAGEEARATGSPEVGTHHLLIGLMEEGFAAAVLERLGVRAEALRSGSAALFGEPGPAGTAVPPRSEQARCALEEAHRLVCRSHGDAVVGTEHLLFVLATDPGGRARRVLNELGVDPSAIKRELDLRPARRLDVRAGRRRRRTAEKAECSCSFCRRPRSATGPQVAGPGVNICQGCVSRARDALHTRSHSSD